jgi:GntR family transcriptional regulator of arabinose operon
MEYFLNGIRTRQWTEGEALPSENRLAETMRVSRITIKHALDELVREGLVYRIQGKGTFLSPGSKGEPAIFDPGISGKLSMPVVAYLAPRLHNDHMVALLNSIEEELSARHCLLLFSRTHENLEIEKTRLMEMERLGVRGIIIFPVDGEVYNEKILRLTLDSFPLVVIDRYLRGLETNCVCSDNISGGFQAAEHLFSLGHRNIAFVSTNIYGTSSIEDRFTGYERAFAAHGIPIQPKHILTSLKLSDKKNSERIGLFLKENPAITGVVAVNSTVGLQIIEAAAGLGRGIPDDLSVVFFDRQDPFPLKPTYIKQEAANIAKEAVSLLFEIIGSPSKKRIKTDLPTTLVTGDSTAAPGMRG